VISKDRKKHADLARPAFGNFNRNEWAIVGGPCTTIKILADQIIKALSPEYKCGYVDAAHSDDVKILPGRLANGAVLEFTKSLDAEIVVFTSSTAQYVGVDWLTRLVSYVAMDPAVGAAGGKVLDPWLQIRSGGMLVDEDGEFRTIAGGNFENESSHWFIGQVASNVDAVSSQLMATRRRTLIETGGLRLHEFGDAAGVAYSAALVSNGYRIVYDPHSRHCDAGRLTMPERARSLIRELGRRIAPLRRYEGLAN